MIKPNALRAWLEQLHPEFRVDPDRLELFIEEGAVRTRYGGDGPPNLHSFRYEYRLQIEIHDFAGHPDSIFAPLLLWIARHEPELLAPTSDKSKPGIRFDSQILDADKIELTIALELTESVFVTRRQDGGWNMEHRGEPAEPDGDVRNWSLWLREQLLLEWTQPDGSPVPEL